MSEVEPVDLTIVGGGMITNDLLLPSVYQLQRAGTVRNIGVCSLNTPPLAALAESSELRAAFPGHSFRPYPELAQDPNMVFPDLYKEVLAAMAPRQAVIVAVPDHLHYSTVMTALHSDQHVLCVKPLVLQYQQAREIEQLAHEKGLFVGVEYHKRFDRRALVARRQYRLGHFGQFVIGEAKLIEPYYYRHSNFQNWFTTENTDPFVYVGCHYVDLVYFITGLRPTAVSVSGVKGRFPNGNEAYMWTNGRVVYENGAVLSVTDGLGYPDAGAGSNDQGLLMYCEGHGASGLIQHDDQYRGVRHCYLDPIGPGGSRYNYVSPDFFRLVPRTGGPGAMPVGYGPDSVAATINTIGRIEREVAGMHEGASLSRRQELIRQVDEQGIIATPANSSVNELVIEAARMSVLGEGAWVEITGGDNPRVEFRANTAQGLI